MIKKIKVCLIGAGRIGLYLEADKKRLKPATHFGMWLNEKNVNLSAICDKNPNLREKLSVENNEIIAKKQEVFNIRNHLFLNDL